jgi:hypothetical protein
MHLSRIEDEELLGLADETFDLAEKIDDGVLRTRLLEIATDVRRLAASADVADRVALPV